MADTLSRMLVASPADEREAVEKEANHRHGCVLFPAETGPTLTARNIATGTRRNSKLARALAEIRSGWEAVVDPDLVPYKSRQEALLTDADCELCSGAAAC